MKRLATTLVFASMLLAGGSAFAGQVSIGIQIGAPPPPRVVRVLPHRPGPQYLWVDGYWFPHGNRYDWRDGYWVRPPYPGGRWVAPRYVGRQYYQGYWSNDRRYDNDHRYERYDRKHDHDWDRGRDRDRYRGRR